MFHLVLKRIFRITYIIISLNWIKVSRLYNCNANVILWIPKLNFRYFGGDAFLWDFSNINAFVKHNVKFKICFGLSIGKHNNKTIIYTLSNNYNVFGFKNYVSVLKYITHQLEMQNNNLIMNSYEVGFWENKAFMHNKFKELNINEPRTKIYEFNEFRNIPNDFNYPFLIKSEHSCSSKGIYKINGLEDLENLMNHTSFTSENEVVIAQTLLNMRRDLRVILVGEKIITYYWRINTEEEWRPTSTSYGSTVDFNNFPEIWREHIIETFKKLKLSTGAFDIAWEDDNLLTEPLYLEVSPVFQPNPKMINMKKHYSVYKKKYTLINSWDRRYIDLIYRIKLEQIELYKTKMNF